MFFILMSKFGPIREELCLKCEITWYFPRIFYIIAFHVGKFGPIREEFCLKKGFQ